MNENFVDPRLIDNEILYTELCDCWICGGVPDVMESVVSGFNPDYGVTSNEVYAPFDNCVIVCPQCLNTIDPVRIKSFYDGEYNSAVAASREAYYKWNATQIQNTYLKER